MSAGEACRHVVGFLDFFIDVFLEVQNKRYSWILYLIDYIAYGLHLLYKIYIFKEICRKPIPLHPGLGSSLHNNSVLFLQLGIPLPRLIFVQNLASLRLQSVQVSCKMGTSRMMILIKSWLNSWTTSSRMEQEIGDCVFCCGGGDALHHYLRCDHLWTILISCANFFKKFPKQIYL